MDKSIRCERGSVPNAGRVDYTPDGWSEAAPRYFSFNSYGRICITEDVCSSIVLSQCCMSCSKWVCHASTPQCSVLLTAHACSTLSYLLYSPDHIIIMVYSLVQLPLPVLCHPSSRLGASPFLSYHGAVVFEASPSQRTPLRLFAHLPWPKTTKSLHSNPVLYHLLEDGMKQFSPSGTLAEL